MGHRESGCGREWIGKARPIWAKVPAPSPDLLSTATSPDEELWRILRCVQVHGKNRATQLRTKVEARLYQSRKTFSRYLQLAGLIGPALSIRNSLNRALRIG